MGQWAKEVASKFQTLQTFAATGVIGLDPYTVGAERRVRVVVTGVGGGNVIKVQGRIKGASSYEDLATITGPDTGTTVDISVYDQIRFNCTTYSASGTPTLVASGFFSEAAGGGGGAVDSVNGNTGTVILNTDDISEGATNKYVVPGMSFLAGDGSAVVPSYGFNDEPGQDLGMYRTGNSIGWANQGVNTMQLDPGGDLTIQGNLGAVDGTFSGNISAANYPPSGSNNTVAGFNGSGTLASISGWNVDATNGGANINLTNEPNASGYITLHNITADVDPQGNSPADGMNFLNLYVNHDLNSSGFTYGTGGSAYNMLNVGFSHNGTGNVGSISILNANPDVGNGTDPIEVGGYAGVNASIQVDANVTMKNGIQGFIFQPNVNAAAVMHSSSYINGFTDNSNLPVAINGYSSFNAGPVISSINTATGYNGVNLNPTITTLSGSASVVGFNMAGSITSSGTGGFTGVNVNTSYTTVPAAGYFTAANLSGQINTLTGSYNGVLVAPDINGGAGNATGVTIAMGSMDNTGNKYGLDVQGDGDAATVAIQSSGGHHNLNCDVLITSGLGQQYGNIMGGALTMGANNTITGTDVLANNLAYTIDLGSGTTSYTSSFFGIANVGFVGQITGSSSGVTDNVQFLLVGYNAAHSAGTVTNLYNINCLAITSGAGGTITNSIGYHYDCPFGPVATDHWGIKVDYADAHNHLEGYLSVGTASKKTANTSVGIELESTTKAVLLSRMTTTQRDALTAIDGMILYNTTTSKIQGYAGGAWVDLH